MGKLKKIRRPRHRSKTEDEDVFKFIVPASTSNLIGEALVSYNTFYAAIYLICTMYYEIYINLSAEHCSLARKEL